MAFFLVNLRKTAAKKAKIRKTRMASLRAAPRLGALGHAVSNPPHALRDMQRSKTSGPEELTLTRVENGGTCPAFRLLFEM